MSVELGMAARGEDRNNGFADEAQQEDGEGYIADSL